MVGAHRSKAQATLLAMALLGASILTSCGSVPQSAENSALPASSAVTNQASEAPAPTGGVQGLTANISAPQPQLVRTANLNLSVDSVKQAIEQSMAIARQQQGEVMNLQNRTPTEGEHHTASIEIRVPQAKLDAAIVAFSKLGTVQQQTLQAEDVSDLLVDYQARLRNLRKAEATVLQIMDRSGNISDVLKVTQELNNIRQSIEQINAQLSRLQNQVSYSTIELRFESVIAPVPAQPAVQTQLVDSWNDATQSIGRFTVDLMQIGIWLMVYSPYWLVVGSAVTLLYRRRRRVREVCE
ncbi:MAG: DUF4349 domain-containing protein [Drouetiella hepatica Uher 2000/2452]|jgi:hypothetical protein|uniref:DUF4349 domain-containing protein n=1 Tax=Drouetiella hepatica Uher 2000/2452 TaxID=904376 RepID=A0A951QBJ2_9CYAN|nr:DUF4349 domain-containing protein [Drouetiella hepatica Uher 2000/2452]